MGDANTNDHDLLITLNANLAVVMRQQNELMEKMDRRVSALELRMNQSENKDSRDSEKFQAISAQMQQSLNNDKRITEAFKEIETIRAENASLKAEFKALHENMQEVKDEQLRNRNVSYTWNSINSLVATIAAALGLNWRP